MSVINNNNDKLSDITQYSSDRLSNDAYDLHQTLLDVQKLTTSGYTGSLIPHIWFQHVIFPNGKPDLLGMFILADTVYWYRAVFKSDESTGKVQCIKKKFKADMLQRGVGAYAEQFGVSKRQVTDALTRLAEKNLIIRELRTISTAHGNIGNVLFLAPNGKTLLTLQDSLAFEDDSSDFDNGNSVAEDPYVIERIPLRNQTHKGMQSNAIASVNKRDTYTKTTTKITTKNTTAAAKQGSEHDLQDDHTTTIVAAAAFEKNDEDKNSRNDKSIKTSSANSQQQQASKKPIQAESLLGDELTLAQQDWVRKKIKPLAKFCAKDLSVLIDEVTTVLLDSKSFKKTGRDFGHKLHAITKEIKKGEWLTPAKLLLAKEQQVTAIIEKKNCQHKALREELQEHHSNRTYWQKILTYSKREQDVALYQENINRCDMAIARIQQQFDHQQQGNVPC